MRLRELAVAGLLASALIAGCGGGDGDSDQPAPVDPELKVDAPVTNLTKKDEIQLVKLTETLKAAAADKDAAAVCAAFEKQTFKELFGSQAVCLKNSKIAFEMGQLKDLQIDQIAGTPKQATVTYKSGEPAKLFFVKRDGKWYVGSAQTAAPGGTK